MNKFIDLPAVAQAAMPGGGGIFIISDSSVLIGNSGDNVTVGGSAQLTDAERELLRVFNKLDLRHKADFLGRVYAYEDEYDKRSAT